ncbi:MAG: XdhC family protein [Steroidobacteraceae bacterium]
MPLGQAFRLDLKRRTLIAFGIDITVALPDTQLVNPPLLSAAGVQATTFEPDGAVVRLVPIEQYLNILLLGAGADVQPLTLIATMLGWATTIVDHRAAYAVAEHFPPPAQVLLSPAAEVASAVDLNTYDAAVVMSHHLTSDCAYLRALASGSVAYVGLLGSAARRARLLRELGAELSGRLAARLRALVGLDIGATTPRRSHSPSQGNTERAVRPFRPSV